MTYRSAASIATALKRALTDPTPTVGLYDRRTARFDVTPSGDVMERAAGVATTLLEGGVVRGQPVLVAGAGPDQLWLGYLGSVLAGATPLLLPVRPSLDRAIDVARRLAAVRRQVPDGLLLVATTDRGPTVEPGSDPWLPLNGPGAAPATPGAAADLVGRLERYAATPSTPLHLQLTSGSTGDPRPVVVTHGNAVANVDSFVRAFDTTPASHLVCWLPLYHDLALMGSAVVSLLAGCHLRLLSPFDFMANPANWLLAVAQCPEAVSAGPGFALDQVVRRLDPAECSGLDLSCWRHCITGAEPIDVRTVARFLDRLEPFGLQREAMRFGYGLAEATLSVSVSSGLPKGVEVERLHPAGGVLPALGPMPVVSPIVLAVPGAGPADGVAAVACLGRPLPGVEIEIVDPDRGTPVGAEECGEVVVIGPSVSPGYRRPDGTVESFPGGRCLTGDLGFLYQGELYLVDRRKNVVIRNGRTWSASALEAQLATGAGIPFDHCAIVQLAFGDERVVAVVERDRRGDDADLLDAVRRATADLELAIDEVALVRRGGLPRTTSGKKQHLELRAGLRTGEIEPVARVLLGAARPPDSIDLDHLGPPGPAEAAALDAVIAAVTMHARLRGWTGAAVDERTRLQADLGLDSLGLLELAADLLVATGLAIDEEILASLVTVGDLARAAVTADDRGSAAVARLGVELPQLLRRVDAQQGRQLLIDGRWVTDLASVNYLGLDLDPVVLGSVGPMVERWGTHPSWTRIVASPAPYHQLEHRLAELVGGPDTLVFPTITLTHLGLLPQLATRSDTLIVDRSAHHSVQEAAELAAARGATVRRFEHRDRASLSRALDGVRGRPVVAVNGVYSMTGTVPDLAVIVELTAAAGGVVYVDDAHGLGILGRAPTPDAPYGTGGGGVVAHLGLGYDHIVYVAGLSKAFSSMGAFVTCRDPDERARFEQASTAVFSGPVPVASLATALAGLAVNAERGDDLRSHLHRLTARAIDGARERGWPVDNPLAFPVINLVTGGVERTVAASKVMWEHGILFTPSVFPAAPLDRGGFRISFTAANTDDDVDRLLAALDAVTAALGPPPALVGAWSSVPDA